MGNWCESWVKTNEYKEAEQTLYNKGFYVDCMADVDAFDINNGIDTIIDHCTLAQVMQFAKWIDSFQ